MNNKIENDTDNKSWKIESVGIDIIPESKCKGKPIELFWIWFAANIGVLGIVYGSIIVSFNLSFFQSILAAVVGIASFSLVGFTSLAGKLGRTSTLTLSRAVFGIKGNIGPTLFSWINLLGWEIVNIVTGTLSLIALMVVFGFNESIPLTICCLILFSGLIIIVSIFGQETVVMMQSLITKIFGTLTLIVVLYILFTTEWNTALSLQPGNWLTGFLPATSIIAAGTGISWAIAGADYSRYQNKNANNLNIFSAVTIGAFIPLFILIFTGILISIKLPTLADSQNPINLIMTTLPDWLSIPYLITALVGIITISVLSLYSASLNLLTLGIKVKQKYAVAINSLIVLGTSIYILFVSDKILNPFMSFLIISGVFLSSWIAIFILDYSKVRKYTGYKYKDLYSNNDNKNIPTTKTLPIICWLIGSIIGLMVTKAGFISGPFAFGIFANSNLGLFIAFIISFILYWIYLYFNKKNIFHGDTK